MLSNREVVERFLDRKSGKAKSLFSEYGIFLRSYDQLLAYWDMDNRVSILHLYSRFKVSPTTTRHLTELWSGIYTNQIDYSVCREPVRKGNTLSWSYRRGRMSTTRFKGIYYDFPDSWYDAHPILGESFKTFEFYLPRKQIQEISNYAELIARVTCP